MIKIYLAHEMNGNWYPWSRDAVPNDYILAWRHVHDMFSSKNLNSTRLQWV
jgi:beta-mannanase